MKRMITGCMMLALSASVLADCTITSSTQNIDYGKRSAAMRQADRGKTTQLTDRSTTLILQCEQKSRIRLQLSSTHIVSNSFGFGADGTLNASASNAISGSDNLNLALVNSKNESVSGVGTPSVSPTPGNWLVFMKEGQEAEIDGSKSVSLTLTIAPSFKDETAITDMTDISGNLSILVEAQ